MVPAAPPSPLTSSARRGTPPHHGPAVGAWLAGLALAVLSACGPDATPPRHLLLVTLDTTRADRLGCYGHAGASTPVIDSLAASGVVFERCQAVAPTTLPSHASLLTGLYPFRHGARNNGTHVLPADVTTLAERLSTAGFATGAAVSARVLDGTFGLDQGFASYDDRLSGAVGSEGVAADETPASDTVDRALEWLGRQDGRRPVFLWLHLFDPHQPLVPPEPHRSAHADGYDGEIAYADAQLGRLLAGLERQGLRDDTLVVVTADHGESLGEHGEPTHGLFVYESTQHVPLVLSHRSLPAGRRVAAVTSGVDVVPTALDLLGLTDTPDAANQGLDGRSLRPLLEGADDWPDDRAVYAETLYPLYAYGWSDLAAQVDRTGRFVRAPRPEWYNHLEDPDELDDRAAAAPGVVAAAARRLDALLADGERGRDLDAAAGLDDELRASLAALGYTAAARPSVDPADRLDPKDGVDDLALADRAGELVATGRAAQALPLLERLEPSLAAAPEVASLTAQALLAADRRDEALALLREIASGPAPLLSDLLRLAELEHAEDPARAAVWLERFRQRAPDSPLAPIQEGAWALAAGDGEAARRAYDRALAKDPASVPAWLGKGRAQQLLGDDSGALTSFRQAQRHDPQEGEVQLALGWQALRMGRADDAAQALSRAVERLPDQAGAWAALGAAEDQRGRRAEAERSYRRALQLQPDDLATLANLARLLLADGRLDEALELGRRGCAAGAAGSDACLVAVSALRRRGQLAQALELLASLRGGRPDWVPALLEEVLLRLDGGDEPAARATLQQALALKPGLVRQRASAEPALAALLGAAGG